MAKEDSQKDVAKSDNFRCWLAQAILGNLDLPGTSPTYPYLHWPQANKTSQWKERAHYLVRATQFFDNMGWSRKLGAGYKVPIHDKGEKTNI